MYAVGQHITAGTKTVHLVASVRSQEALYMPGRPVVFCQVGSVGSQVDVKVTEAEVTCKSCAKHL